VSEYTIYVTEKNVWETKINANSEKEALEKAESKHSKNGFTFEFYKGVGTPIVSFTKKGEPL